MASLKSPGRSMPLSASGPRRGGGGVSFPAADSDSAIYHLAVLPARAAVQTATAKELNTEQAICHDDCRTRIECRRR
jgi:hypothetical protein